MVRFLCVILAFVCASAENCGQIKVPSVYDLRDTFLSGQNPRDAVHGLSPWTLSLEYAQDHVCGAVLVGANWALTSARCVSDRDAASFRVIAGVVDRSSRNGDEQIIDVAGIVVHPNFEADGWSYPNDLALLELAEEADIAGRVINTICLPPSSDTKYWENPSSLLTGWGLTAAGEVEYPSMLQQAWIDVIRPAYCDLWWPEVTPVNHTFHQCAFDQVDREVSICQGDEGSPLQSMVDGTYYLAGVASFGSTDCDRLVPSVYTDVPTYLDWIQGVIGAGQE